MAASSERQVHKERHLRTCCLQDREAGLLESSKGKERLLLGGRQESECLLLGGRQESECLEASSAEAQSSALPLQAAGLVAAAEAAGPSGRLCS